MHVVDQLKKLICHSRLFVDEETLKKPPGKKRARRRDNVKIGQGGTLDPLADGVLGQCPIFCGFWESLSLSLSLVVFVR